MFETFENFLLNEKKNEVVYEEGEYWIKKIDNKQYEVYKKGTTYSARIGIASAENDNKAYQKALKMLKDRIDGKLY